MKDKYGVEEKEKKTTKAVRFLKATFRKVKGAVKWGVVAFKWANKNVTMGQVIKWGMVLLIILAMVQGWVFGSSIPVVNAALKRYFSGLF